MATTKSLIVFTLSLLSIIVYGGDCLGFETIGELLDRTLSKLAGQLPSNENGTEDTFREYALSDTSNDEIANYRVNAVQKILVRSGYKYESHYVLADDGYITQLVRIINPLADKSKLKRPPVMLFHGGIIDTTAYIFASPIQHHPEKYPRVEGDPPITSWNRSLGLMLANNGYDVWLVGTRGAIREGRGVIKENAPKDVIFGNTSITEQNYDKVANVALTDKYWSYSMDQITHFEYPRQIQKVLEITGSPKVSLFGFSFGSQILFSLLSSAPAIAQRVHNLIIMAPLINQQGSSPLIKYLQDKYCANLPIVQGVNFFNKLVITDSTIDILVKLFRNPVKRYNIHKPITAMFMGPSAKYRMLLDLGVLRHILVPTGFVEYKQYCQQVRAGRLQRFDFGALRNMLYYKSATPPIYNISNINVENWLLIGGGNDILSSPEQQQYILDHVRPKGKGYVFAPTFNHLDLIGAFENDVQVNLPVLRFLDEHAKSD